jgi:hypothetical protein
MTAKQWMRSSTGGVQDVNGKHLTLQGFVPAVVRTGAFKELWAQSLLAYAVVYWPVGAIRQLSRLFAIFTLVLRR